MNVQSKMYVQTSMEDIALKKKVIFESTLQLIRQHGFHGAPMSRIAKNADVAAGTIYHYFESKDHLICELYKYNRQRVIEVVKEALASDGSFQEKFLNVWNNMQIFYQENPNVLIFFEQYINSPYNQNKQEQKFADRPLYNFFKEGVRKGILKDAKPEVLMVMVMASIISTAKLNKFGQIKLSKNDMNQVVDIIWDGISK